MSKYIALVGFAGEVSMYKNEIKELTNEDTINDLIKAKYIKKIEETTEEIESDIPIVNEEVNESEDK